MPRSRRRVDGRGGAEAQPVRGEGVLGVVSAAEPSLAVAQQDERVPRRLRPALAAQPGFGGAGIVHATAPAARAARPRRTSSSGA